jgi:uncharacterized membrane protein
LKTIKKFLNALSYLQYPLMLLGLFFIYKPLFLGFENLIDNYNNGLIIMGVAISFSTLQDTTKTQNKLSLWVFQSEKRAKVFLIWIVILVLFFIISGAVGYFLSPFKEWNELSIGLMVFGIGVMGLLKAATEMSENHRIAKSN